MNRIAPAHVPERETRVLVVDDHHRARESIQDILECAGLEVVAYGSAIEALRWLERETCDLIITDLRMPGMDGLDFMRALQQRGVDAQVVMMTAHASVASAVEAMRYGAFDYIEKPFTADQLETLLRRALRHGEAVGPRSQMLAEAGAMVGTSRPMKALCERIAQVAPTVETVLITGESGVGKELVARAIHAASDRASGALVSVNCPALSPQLMESELFGHERGSFTNADAPREGRFELADRGTIFLDEVTEISLPLQAKLLRVLQEKTFERVGASASRSVDARVIASSNRLLRQEVAAGSFREDLYFRLAVVPIHVPPLRERRDDVPVLIEHFCRQSSERLGKPPCELAPASHELLTEYRWPGNVRELENIITRACVLCSGKTVTPDELRPWLIDQEGDAPPFETAEFPAGMKLQEMERRLIEATLERFQGHRAQTARALGIGVRTLTNKLRNYGYAPREKCYSRAA